NSYPSRGNMSLITAKAIVVGVKEKGLGRMQPESLGEPTRSLGSSDSSLYLSRCHRHRTTQTKAKWAYSYAPLLSIGDMSPKLAGDGDGGGEVLKGPPPKGGRPPGVGQPNLSSRQRHAL